MTAPIKEVLDLLDLESIEVNIFRGTSPSDRWQRVFGGQVLGQALVAASRTVEDRIAHSLHAYFIRPGDPRVPILYEVDRARDGKSFTTRRVVAIQHGEQIFNLSASFQVEEQGLSHQFSMPKVPPPEQLQDFEAYVQNLPSATLPEKLRRMLNFRRPFEFRPVSAPNFGAPQSAPPYKQVWFRTIDRLPDDQALHRALLAYVSDYNLLDCCLLPHALNMACGIIMASIDHAMWFHRDLRVDDWLLYDVDSPSTSGARGLARGTVYARDGTLVASTCQEGLLRLPDAQSAE